MLTEAQVDYLNYLQTEISKTFQESNRFFEDLNRLEVAKANLENVLPEKLSQELVQNWSDVSLTSEAYGGNDLIVVLMAKSKMINSKSDFDKFIDFYTNLIKPISSNRAKIKQNNNLLENIKKELKSSDLVQLEEILLSARMFEDAFIIYVLRPLLDLDTFILEGRDVFGYEKVSFPEEYIEPIRNAVEKNVELRTKTCYARSELSNIIGFETSPKGYHKNFRAEHENNILNFTVLQRDLSRIEDYGYLITGKGWQLIRGEFGIMEYLSLLNGGEYDNVKYYTDGIELLTRYKTVVEKEKARLEAVREEGDNSILNELGQLYLLSRTVDTAKNMLSETKDLSKEAFHELIQAVHGVIENSKYY